MSKRKGNGIQVIPPPRTPRAALVAPGGGHLRSGVGRHIEAPRYWYCCGL